MGSTNVSSNHSLGEFGAKSVKLAQDLFELLLKQNEHTIFGLTSHEEPKHETEKSGRSTILGTPSSGASVSGREQSPIDDASFCSTSSLCPAPICRQFWKAGNYDDNLNSKPTCQSGTSYLRIHPKFLHSNATSHKWVFGAIAELLDNSVDEIRNGATSVILDKTLNPRDGTPALLIQDDGGGMDPEAMRHCLSFGFSDKKSQNAIGKYGNGFKTSSMRLGADAVIFSRHKRDRKLTQSWSPLATEAELLKQCDDIGPHGTKIIVYNLWHDDEGKLELDFDSNPEDICISGKVNNTAKAASRTEATKQHLANRLRYSLRAYLSILYLQVPEKFCILLRGRVVAFHNIANDLKFPEFILYRPHNVEGSIITTIGFLKEAPAVNIHGFNVYHKNRLILPFWHVVAYSQNRGRGVVGVLEANFIEPTHNKQDFEKTQVFQKLEARLKAMTLEYWDYHCGLIGYQGGKKPQAITPRDTSDCGLGHGIYQPVILGKDWGASGEISSFAAGGSPREVSCSSDHVSSKSRRPLTPTHQNTQEATLKRKGKGHDDIAELRSVKRRGVVGSGTFDRDRDGDVQLVADRTKQSEDQEAASLIQEIQIFHAQCEEYEKMDEELNLKITRLVEEVGEAQGEYCRMLLELELLEKVKKEYIKLRS